MNDKLIELLLKIESLNTEDLEKVSAWIEYNLNKRKSEDCELPNCFTQIHTYQYVSYRTYKSNKEVCQMEDKTISEILSIVAEMNENQISEFIQTAKKFLQAEEPSFSDPEQHHLIN